MCEEEGSAMLESWIVAVGLRLEHGLFVVPHRSGKRCLVVDAASGTVTRDRELGSEFAVDEPYAACAYGNGFAVAVSPLSGSAIRVAFVDPVDAPTKTVDVACSEGTYVAAMLAGPNAGVWLVWFEPIVAPGGASRLDAAVRVGFVHPDRGVVWSADIGHCIDRWIRESAIAAERDQLALMWDSRSGIGTRRDVVAATIDWQGGDDFAVVGRTLSQRPSAEIGSVTVGLDQEPIWAWVETGGGAERASTIVMSGAGVVEEIPTDRPVVDVVALNVEGATLVVATVEVGHWTDEAGFPLALCGLRSWARDQSGRWTTVHADALPAACTWLEVTLQGRRPAVMWREAQDGEVGYARWLEGGWGPSIVLGSIDDHGVHTLSTLELDDALVIAERDSGDTPEVRIRRIALA